jgi:hypothetical protein
VIRDVLLDVECIELLSKFSAPAVIVSAVEVGTTRTAVA